MNMFGAENFCSKLSRSRTKVLPYWTESGYLVVQTMEGQLEKGDSGVAVVINYVNNVE